MVVVGGVHFQGISVAPSTRTCLVGPAWKRGREEGREGEREGGRVNAQANRKKCPYVKEGPLGLKDWSKDLGCMHICR